MKCCWSRLMTAVLLLWAGGAAFGQSPSISFQGQLKSAGVPLTGTRDFRFRLKDAAEDGSTVATSIGRNGVAVTNGLFQVELDWDAALFATGPRWIEVSVRINDRDPYTILAPRIPVGAAPVALYATSAPGGGGAGGSLDQAYDNGGAGLGRVIQADAGRVEVLGPDGFYSQGGVVGGAGRLGLPTATFDVESRKTLSLTGDPTPPATVGGIIVTGNILNPTEKWNFLRTAPSGHALRRDIGSSLAFDVEGAPNSSGLWITQMMLDADGNLGVGWPVPETRVHVVGGTDVEPSGGGFLTLGRTDERNLAFDDNEIMCQTNGVPDTLYLNNDGGNVSIGASAPGFLGIGTSFPAARLHIRQFSDAELNQNGGIVIGNTSSTNITMDDNEIMSRNNGSASSLFINNAGGNVYFGGSVGIGTQSASEKLHVNGTARVNVLKITGGADVAEGFDLATGEAAAGTVLVIDTAHPGKLSPSRSPYDRKVAGVVSGAGGVASGMVLGHGGTIADGAHAVALSGRVYCLVDAREEAVVPGDLLTTSSLEGHAMKASDTARASGAVLGKAMTGLGKGEIGLVLILVTLQ